MLPLQELVPHEVRDQVLVHDSVELGVGLVYRLFYPVSMILFQVLDLLLFELDLYLHVLMVYELLHLVVLFVLISPTLESLSQIEPISSYGFGPELGLNRLSVANCVVFPLHEVSQQSRAKDLAKQAHNLFVVPVADPSPQRGVLRSKPRNLTLLDDVQLMILILVSQVLETHPKSMETGL